MHWPAGFDVHFFGSAPPAGLSPQIKHRASLYNREGASALADLRADAIVMEGSIWSLYRLLGREIGRASCRERVSVRVDLGGRRIIKKNKLELHTSTIINCSVSTNI